MEFYMQKWNHTLLKSYTFVNRDDVYFMITALISSNRYLLLRDHIFRKISGDNYKGLAHECKYFYYVYTHTYIYMYTQ